jgi:SAM-dependent methyltransferase
MDVPASQGSKQNDDRGRGVLDDLDVLGFEKVYEAAGDDLTRVPWAGLRAHPLLCAWLDDHPAPEGQRALVIACGLGDDAEELRRRGYNVTAFDASPTAIGWCRKRFPDSTVDYHVADLFSLPPAWHQAFDLVVEIHTIQALPPPRHDAVIAAVAQTVAPGGKVVVITFGRPETEEARNGPPWPLRRSELAAFAAEGLREVDGFEDWITDEHLGPDPILRWRIVYERPEAADAR